MKTRAVTGHLQCAPKPEANYNAEGAELLSTYYVQGGVGVGQEHCFLSCPWQYYEVLMVVPIYRGGHQDTNVTEYTSGSTANDLGDPPNQALPNSRSNNVSGSGVVLGELCSK